MPKQLELPFPAREPQRGDTVVCARPRGYSLTAGRTYEVLHYTPEWRDTYFTWPAYITVADDYGDVVTGHASRFTYAESIGGNP